MAADPLSLAESLRPWRNAGVLTLLNPPDLGDLFIQPDWTLLPPQTLLPSFPPETAQFTIDAEDTPPSPESESQSGLSAEVSPPPTFRADQNTKIPPAQPPFLSKSGLSEAEQTATWPEAWRKIYSRTPKAPLLWTYAELGLDLSGQGEAGRSQFLKELIARLDLPRGSSTFWPLCLPASAAAQAALPLSPEYGPETTVKSPGQTSSQSLLSTSGTHPDTLVSTAQRTANQPAPALIDADIFQAGLPLLKPTLIIFFGPQAVNKSGLPLDIHSPFTLQIYSGLLNVLLPPLDYLLNRENGVEQCFNFLRDVFADFPPLAARFRMR